MRGERTWRAASTKSFWSAISARIPKVANLNSGDRAVSFTLATSETWKDKNTGERREKTEWHNVVIYNENFGRVVEQYCKKGTKVYLEGQIADAQIYRPVRRREIHHRDRAAALPRRADAARFARRRRRRATASPAAKSAAPSFGRSSPGRASPGAGGAAAAAGATSTTISRSDARSRRRKRRWGATFSRRLKYRRNRRGPRPARHSWLQCARCSLCEARR